jgi:hypothetical protein
MKLRSLILALVALALIAFMLGAATAQTPPSITPSTESVTVTTSGSIAFPAGRQLAQTFTAATRASTAPVMSGQLGWETDTGILYRANGTSAGNWVAVLSGGGLWGSIAGTLSNQTDLQSALDAKLSIAGAVTSYQPLDFDLTSVAALTTTAFGRSLLTLGDSGSLAVAAGLGNVEDVTLSLWTGSANITTTGTITTGSWQGDVIQAAYGGTGFTTLTELADELLVPQPQGTWAAGIAYSRGDSVIAPGEGTFIALQPHVSDTDENGILSGANWTSYWVKLSDSPLLAYPTPWSISEGGTGATNASAARANLGLVIGANVQAFDSDLADLADGSLTGSKVGSGIDASNITTGTLPPDRLGTGSALQVLRRNAANDALEFATLTSGDTPGGSGSELQYRAGPSTLGAVTGSATSNGGITLAPSSGSALTLTGGTVTESAPLMTGTQTFGAAGVTFRGVEITITDTASASDSTLFRVRGGASGTTDAFTVTKDSGLDVKSTNSNGRVLSLSSQYGSTNISIGGANSTTIDSLAATNYGSFTITSGGGGPVITKSVSGHLSLEVGPGKNIALFGFGSYGGGGGVVFIKNCATAPFANPTGGGVLFVENGALKYRGSSGTVTTIAPP